MTCVVAAYYTKSLDLHVTFARNQGLKFYPGPYTLFSTHRLRHRHCSGPCRMSGSGLRELTVIPRG